MIAVSFKLFKIQMQPEKFFEGDLSVNILEYIL